MTDEVAVPGTGRGRKEIVRYLLGVAVGILVLLLLFGKRAELRPAWHHVSHASLSWIGAGVAVEALSLLIFSVLQRRVLHLSGTSIPLPPLALLSLANDAISNTVPGEPVISSAYRYRYYRRRGASAASAGWTIFTILVAQAIGMSLLLLLGVLIALAGGGGARQVAASAAGLVIIVAAVAVLLRRDLILRMAASLSRRAGRIRAAAALAGRVEVTLARMGEIPLGAGAATGVAGLAASVWFTDFLCLVCAFLAIHGRVPWAGILLAYGVAQVAGTLPFVPGGIGIIEGSLAIILIGYGASRPSALAAAVVYRVISFWLAIAAGWISVGVIAFRDLRSKMSTPSSPTHLNNHHRNTLRQIFEHPVSHNIEWHAVVSLLGAVGTVEQYHDGKVQVTLGQDTTVFEPPRGKDIDVSMTSALRKMLADAGYGPEDERH